MCKTGIFMADGCEEIEGLTVVDLLRRANLEIVMISINQTTTITGSHGISFEADTTFENVNFDEFDAVVLPGGIPGTPNLGAHEGVNRIIREFSEKGKLVSAICAAPSVLGEAGILKGKHATCYPGFESKLTGAITSKDAVITDGNIITSRGMGTAIDFALAIISYLKDADIAADLSKKIIYR